MKLKIATIAAASALAFNAQAIITSTSFGGPHDPFEIATATILAGAFDDIYQFSLSATGSIFSTAVSIDNSDGLGLTNGMVSLFSDAGPLGLGGADSLVDSYTFGGSTGDSRHAFLPQGTGDYYYRVTGNVNGTRGDSYFLTSALTPVPEPQTYALMLAGLGVVGFLARRRRLQA